MYSPGTQSCLPAEGSIPLRIAFTLFGFLLAAPPSVFAQFVPLPASIAVVPGQVSVAPGKTLAREQGLDPQAVYFFRISYDVAQTRRLSI